MAVYRTSRRGVCQGQFRQSPPPHQLSKHPPLLSFLPVHQKIQHRELGILHRSPPPPTRLRASRSARRSSSESRSSGNILLFLESSNPQLPIFSPSNAILADAPQMRMGTLHPLRLPRPLSVYHHLHKPSAEVTVVGRSYLPTQAFVVVRSPPSKSNHPLNLQVQLVPTSSRDHNRSASSRRSSDSLATNTELEGQPPLTRTSSNRSDVSTCSGYASSVTSVSSANSTMSTRRMIIPLYHLQAHNFMINIVLDAGQTRASRSF